MCNIKARRFTARTPTDLMKTLVRFAALVQMVQFLFIPLVFNIGHNSVFMACELPHLSSLVQCAVSYVCCVFWF